MRLTALRAQPGSLKLSLSTPLQQRCSIKSICLFSRLLHPPRPAWNWRGWGGGELPRGAGRQGCEGIWGLHHSVPCLLARRHCSLLGQVLPLVCFLEALYGGNPRSPWGAHPGFHHHDCQASKACILILLRWQRPRKCNKGVGTGSSCNLL